MTTEARVQDPIEDVVAADVWTIGSNRQLAARTHQITIWKRNPILELAHAVEAVDGAGSAINIARASGVETIGHVVRRWRRHEASRVADRGSENMVRDAPES